MININDVVKYLLELEAQVADAKSAMQIQSDGYMRLKAENAELLQEIEHLKHTMFI